MTKKEVIILEATIKALVEKVIPAGRHGPYAIATTDALAGSVTFSLERTVWQEEEWPEAGTYVCLGKLRQKRAGWRAKEGRFWELSDEQNSNQNGDDHERCSQNAV